MHKYSLLLILTLFLNGCVFNRNFSQKQLEYLDNFRPNAELTTEPEDHLQHIKVSYFGTSTLLLDDGATQILIDGFFSRPGLLRLITLGFDPNSAASRKRLLDAVETYSLSNLSAVVTAHSHHDHAMDAPLIASITGADLIGDVSTCRLAYGLNDTQKRCYELFNQRTETGLLPPYGNFTISLIKAAHTELPPSIRKLVGLNQSVSEDVDYPARLWDYAEGESYSILIEHPVGSIIVQASTSLAADELQQIDADWLFMSVARLTSLEDKRQIFESLVKGTNAKNIVPIHWDDFTRQVDNKLYPQKYFMGKSFAEIKLFMQLNHELDSGANAYVMDHGDYIFLRY
ncbi:hypothetical protein KUC3_28920 [Alteromonas sp. KC3]|uniref:MBL fold metallo-hydrolase n=1 Tax=unclassified Alteromonas TaxID=2614992 RepID=UPI001922E8DB|nr:MULTISPECIES: MBL fold metallo-hydrolase [unclassified Alteromonas]BCO20035.1 hypothetical protein KUC3_28920 [Alteromonas sp. KC3]BCO24000.1 hypothetical protein KUC14_28690 [Alteromonas sp. KC14]